MILVTREHLNSDDRVSIALWDSDRFSQDDMLGIAEVNLVDLARHPNKLFRRSDTLKGLNRERSKQGIVHWTLGFFTKAPSMRRGSKAGGEGACKISDDGNERKAESETASIRGDDEPEYDGKEMDSESIESDSPLTQGAIDREKNTQTRHQTTTVDFEPPDPSLPSGILSMQIHHIANLEVTDGHTSLRPREKDEPGQDVDNVKTAVSVLPYHPQRRDHLSDAYQSAQLESILQREHGAFYPRLATDAHHGGGVRFQGA